MKVNTSESNPALISIIDNIEQVITLDTNFFIPPHRNSRQNSGFSFDQFKRIWLIPIFELFPILAIHEAVYEEFQDGPIRDFVDGKMQSQPTKLALFKDSELSADEAVLRDTFEQKIYPMTKYDPSINNRDDRGEVKSLAYIAAKGLLYFAAHDNNAIRLITKAEELQTGLDEVEAIHMYEIIYYLYAKKLSAKEDMRILYRYQYHQTKKEKSKNPSWNEFKEQMHNLYSI